MLWEMLDQITLFDFEILENENLENLKKFKIRFSNLPKINEYINSPRFMKSPVNSKRAKWGGDNELKCSWKK